MSIFVAVLGRLQALEDVSQRLQDYNDKARDLGHKLQRIEDSVASHDALGEAAKDPKLLNRMKVMAYIQIHVCMTPCEVRMTYLAVIPYRVCTMRQDNLSNL